MRITIAKKRSDRRAFWFFWIFLYFFGFGGTNLDLFRVKSKAKSHLGESRKPLESLPLTNDLFA